MKENENKITISMTDDETLTVEALRKAITDSEQKIKCLTEQLDKANEEKNAFYDAYLAKQKENEKLIAKISSLKTIVEMM